MPYPLSGTVTSGTRTLASQYNNLRSDALYLGQSSTNSTDLGTLLNRYASGLHLEYYATNRLKIAYNSFSPPTVMVGGYMLQASSTVYLPSSSFSGSAMTWYIFAVHTAGLTSFTLSVNTSPTESADTRLIGEVYWDGSNIVQDSVVSYFDDRNFLPAADYDSGWFSVTTGTTYNKAHGLGVYPRLVVILHSTASDGSSEQRPVYTVTNATGVEMSIFGCNTINVNIQTGAAGTGTTLFCSRTVSTSGYYRVLAWK